MQNGSAKYYSADGTALNKKYFEKQEGKIEIKPSGRYSITKAGKTRYFAADGKELNEKYFKQIENPDVIVKSNGKNYNLNKSIEKRINKVTSDLKKAEDENGFIGKGWSGFKNLTGIGDSSDKVREQQKKEQELLAQFNSNPQRRAVIFKQLTGAEYTPENLEKFIKGQIKLPSELALKGYKEGQEMAVDVTADVVSGVAAFGIYTVAVAGAPFTGGASIAVGVAAAAGTGAAVKTGLKYADAKSGGRDYTLKDARHDAATGAFSGALAPVTAGVGGAVGKTVATKLGIQAVKTVGKDVAEEITETGVKQTIKTALTNPAGYKYVGSSGLKSLSYGTEMLTDGALSGSIDNAFRTALDGGDAGDVLNAAGEGAIGGAILSPIIGGGMKFTGKMAQNLLGKNNIHIDAQGKELLYVRPKSLTEQNILEKLELKPELKSNSLIEAALSFQKRSDISKRQKNLNLNFLDMLISNDMLNKNKSLLIQSERLPIRVSNNKTLNFLEEFVNNPELHDNKYIKGSLDSIIDYYNADFQHQFMDNVIEKFKKHDLSVVSDILKDSNNLRNYYSGIPNSMINKEIEDLSIEERHILTQWMFNNRCHPPYNNLLKSFYPSIPSSDDEFISIINRLQKIGNLDTTPIEVSKLNTFNESLLRLTSKYKESDLRNITSLMPELYPEGKTIQENTIKQLNRIAKTNNFQNLSEKDKKIVILAQLLKDTDNNDKDLSKKIVSISQRFGFSHMDGEKIANVSRFSNLIDDFMNTTKDKIKYFEINNQEIITNNRKAFFDNAAFLLKDGNTFELAKMLYSSKEQKGLSRYLDKMLTKRINEIKSSDFMLPQTQKSVYSSYAESRTVKKNGKIYKVNVAKRSEIENFCAYVHTPENVSAMKEASITQNTSKFMLASNDILSDRVLCACYVDGTSKCFVNIKHYYGKGNGFVLDVANNKQYIGAGADISSIAKNREHLIQSYYKENGLISRGINLPENTKLNEIRTIVSDNLKKILNLTDEEYIMRMDKIKEQLGDEVLSFENLSSVDKEMYDAYKKFISGRIINSDSDFKNAILRDDYEWNEFLISEPKITGLYTTSLELMPEEYLKMAVDPKNNFVIISMYE